MKSRRSYISIRRVTDESATFKLFLNDEDLKNVKMGEGFRMVTASGICWYGSTYPESIKGTRTKDGMVWTTTRKCGAWQDIQVGGRDLFGVLVYPNVVCIDMRDMNLERGQMMRYEFNLQIECDDRQEIINLLEHVKKLVEEDCTSGGYDWACADYNWNIRECEDENREEMEE